ncbi:hypothetical protein RHMOL_Rhmol07G0117900 [Rhododendron molle]|uniref:Uncharacterized protein n=1 Tax=Rhododendron molle TaxID=49168 RepID=A0ACC0N1N8_RHOML|nr:hypothetical protein RHMOL_Rhmol07G0117900 [Rhododendron molle]
MALGAAAGVESVSKAAAKRCSSCNEKVRLLGFQCRCGVTFCGAHRYPEEHDCKFDLKAVGKDAIARENPVVKADKVVKANTVVRFVLDLDGFILSCYWRWGWTPMGTFN